MSPEMLQNLIETHKETGKANRDIPLVLHSRPETIIFRHQTDRKATLGCKQGRVFGSNDGLHVGGSSGVVAGCRWPPWRWPLCASRRNMVGAGKDDDDDDNSSGFNCASVSI